MNGLVVVPEIAKSVWNGNVVNCSRLGLMIAQEEEAGIQSTQEEFEFMAAADAYEETERVKVNCTLEDTLQQASLSGTATMLVLSRDTVKADIYFVWAPAATNETSATKLQTLP
ncbi:hypothetical protein Tco_0097907 [Tanacetum coccineum]